MFGGTYGTYPRRFKQKMLDLASDSLVLRPFCYGLNHERITIAEPVLAARSGSGTSRPTGTSGAPWSMRADRYSTGPGSL
jgi:hypothetical protein